MNKHLIATNPDGAAVYINLVASLAGKQIGLQPHLLTLAQEIIASKSFSGKNIVIETHMGRFVGTNGVVKTTEKDIIFYAKPVGSDMFRRYVKNHSYTPTQYLTLALTHDPSDNSFELTDISVGRSHPSVPTDTQSKTADKLSRAYWSDHAYVWEPKSCQPQTITKDSPWDDAVVSAEVAEPSASV